MQELSAHINIVDVTFPVIREEGIATTESAGPVHEIQIKVIGFEVFQGQIASLLHIFGVVIVVP